MKRLYTVASMMIISAMGTMFLPVDPPSIRLFCWANYICCLIYLKNSFNDPAA